MNILVTQHHSHVAGCTRRELLSERNGLQKLQLVYSIF